MRKVLVLLLMVCLLFGLNAQAQSLKKTVHYLSDDVKVCNKKFYACDICYAERIKDGRAIDFMVEEQLPPVPRPFDDGRVAWEEL